jgi:hypothetical protein
MYGEGWKMWYRYRWWLLHGMDVFWGEQLTSSPIQLLANQQNLVCGILVDSASPTPHSKT